MLKLFVIFALFGIAVAEGESEPNYWVCHFRGNYKCNLMNKALRQETNLKILGDHYPLKADGDVLELNFIESELSYVPSEIFQTFENLEKLNLHGVRLKNFNVNSTFSFQNASKLEILDAGDNELTALYANDFAGANRLRELNLDNGNIKNVSEDAFNGLQKLKILNLNNNKIKVIGVGTFEQLKNLVKVDLSMNKITSLPKNLFQTNMHLQAIYLSSNRISSMSNKMFNSLAYLKFLYLNDNLCVDRSFDNVRDNIGFVHKALILCEISYLENEIEDLKSIAIGNHVEIVSEPENVGVTKNSGEENKTEETENNFKQEDAENSSASQADNNEEQ